MIKGSEKPMPLYPEGTDFGSVVPDILKAENPKNIKNLLGEFVAGNSKPEKPRKRLRRVSANGNVYYHKYTPVKKGNTRRRIENLLHMYRSYLPQGTYVILVDEIMKIIDDQ